MRCLTSHQTRESARIQILMGFPGGSDGKESACNAGDQGLIPGSGRSPGEGNGNPLQYSCLENSMDRGAWRAKSHKELDTTEWLTHTHTDIHPRSPSSKSPAAAAAKSRQSNSVRAHRRQPTRLRRPWDSPGKNTGVGCHFLFQFMKVKRESEVAQSCPTLRNPMDCSLPGSSVHRIFQARVLEWVAIAFSEVPCQSY